MSKIGSNIRKIRSVKGLSQTAFAEVFSISRANIGAYEEGRAEPKIDIAIEMANFFSIPLNDLFTKDLTVNQLTNFKPSLEHGLENKSIAIDQTSLFYISADLMLNKNNLLEKIKSKESLPKIILPEIGPKSGFWCETKNSNINGIATGKVRALICSIYTKPNQGDSILLISLEDIAVGYYKSGSTNITITLLDSGKEVTIEKPKSILKIQLILSDAQSKNKSLEERVTVLEKNLAQLKG